MTIQSSDVVAGSDILASDLNYLRADLLTNDISISGVKTFTDKPVFSDGITGDLKLQATNKLYLDGGNNTYIYEPSGDNIGFVCGGVNTLSLLPTSIVIPLTQKFYIDGGDDTYMTGDLVREFDFYTQDVRRLKVSSTGLTVGSYTTYGNYGFVIYNSAGNYRFTLSTVGTEAFYPHSDGQANLGLSSATDWATIYYHNLSQHSSKKDKENIEIFDDKKIKIEHLPIPKTYKRKNKTEQEFGLIAEDCPDEVRAYDKDGVCMINTNSLITYMVGVIKNQEKRIQVLEAK